MTNTLHPTLAWLTQASAPLSTEPGYPAAVAEETRSHTDVADDLAPVTDIDEGREDRWESRESLMSELGLRESDFRGVK